MFRSCPGRAHYQCRLQSLHPLIQFRLRDIQRRRPPDDRVAVQGPADDHAVAESGFREEQIAYVGDDVIDLPIMRRCGLAIAVANARPQVKAMAHYETASSGGHG